MKTKSTGAKGTKKLVTKSTKSKAGQAVLSASDVEKIVERRLEVERAKEGARKEARKKKKEAKKWGWSAAAEQTIVRTIVGAGAGVRAVGGAAAVLGTYAVTWAYRNKIDFIEDYKRISELEDPMGRWQP